MQTLLGPRSFTILQFNSPRDSSSSCQSAVSCLRRRKSAISYWLIMKPRRTLVHTWWGQRPLEMTSQNVIAGTSKWSLLPRSNRNRRWSRLTPIKSQRKRTAHVARLGTYKMMNTRISHPVIPARSLANAQVTKRAILGGRQSALARVMRYRTQFVFNTCLIPSCVVFSSSSWFLLCLAKFHVTTFIQYTRTRLHRPIFPPLPLRTQSFPHTSITFFSHNSQY